VEGSVTVIALDKIDVNWKISSTVSKRESQLFQEF
jgi:hypothetical protein